MKLRELQHGFQDFVLKLDNGIVPHVQDHGRLSAAARLELYAEAYRLRLVEVLSVHYPVLHAWMGSDEFERLAVAYIDVHPSRRFSVRWFGDRLGEFLHNTALYNERPALAEMARFEWALAEVFDAADIPPVQHTELSAIPAQQWPYLAFSLHPGVTCVQCRWNTVDIWQAVADGREPPDTQQTDVVQVWLVWRAGLATSFRPLQPMEANILDCALSGNSFGEMCALMARDMAGEQVAGELAGLLGVWVRDGIITGINMKTTTG